MKIVTTYIYPPIPIRNHDWCAYDADLEDGAPDSSASPTGFGETEADALMDLIPELVEHYETIAYAEGRKDQAAHDEAADAALDAAFDAHEAAEALKKHGSM